VVATTVAATAVDAVAAVQIATIAFADKGFAAFTGSVAESAFVGKSLSITRATMIATFVSQVHGKKIHR
jgi:hypothetical protein